MPDLERLGRHTRLVTFSDCLCGDKHFGKLEALFNEFKTVAFDALTVPDVLTLADKATFFAMIFEYDDYSYLNRSAYSEYYESVPVTEARNVRDEYERLNTIRRIKGKQREGASTHFAEGPSVIPTAEQFDDWNLFGNQSTGANTFQPSSGVDEDELPLVSSVMQLSDNDNEPRGRVDWVGLYNSTHSLSGSATGSVQMNIVVGREEEQVEAASAHFDTPPETAPGSPLLVALGSPSHPTQDITADQSMDIEAPSTQSFHVTKPLSDSKGYEGYAKIIGEKSARAAAWASNTFKERHLGKVRVGKGSIAAPWGSNTYNIGGEEEKKEHDGCIGFVYLIQPESNQNMVTSGPGEVNMGIILNKKHREKGFASEAAISVLTFAFEELKYHRIQAIILDTPRNIRAITLFTQLHFGHEGTRRRSVYCTTRQEWRDVTYLAILDTDWLMKSHFKPAPRSAWDELFTRHQAEREKLLQGDDIRLKRTASMETVRVNRTKKARNFEDEELERAIALSLLESSSASSASSSIGISTPKSPSMLSVSTPTTSSGWDAMSRASSVPASSSEFDSSDFELMDDDDDSDVDS